MANDKSEEKARDLVQSGSEIAGAAIGGAVGFLAAGPVGAAGAGALGVLIAKSLAQTADKVMSSREKARVGSVAAIAVARIAERVSNGDSPRSDFFTPGGGLQSDGAQLLEGVLLKARDEYEERKLHHLGRFYGNLAFSNISASVASLLIKTFERLTYRQLLLLALICRSGTINVKNLRCQTHVDPELEALKREEMELHGSDFGSTGLVHSSGPFDDRLSSLGIVLAELTEIGDISEDAMSEITTLIACCPESSGIRSSYEM
jgi:hypothetical protein